MIKAAILLDIDNCIANDGGRIPHIRWYLEDPFDRYDAYHQLSPWDAVGNRDLFEGRAERIFMLTSRPLTYRVMTVEWLRRAGVAFEHLLMRNPHDHRSSLAVKRDQMRSLGEYNLTLADVIGAYDDRPEICAMYREHGLRAEVHALHNVCAYINPKTGFNHAAGKAA